MKEREIKFRPFLVCWDNYRCIGWKTEEELDNLIKNNEVNWFKHKTAKNPVRLNYEPPKKDR